MKNIRVFVSENFQFLEVKIFSIYLNKRIFVMGLNGVHTVHICSKRKPCRMAGPVEKHITAKPTKSRICKCPE